MAEQNPLISVIIPTYNAVSYIGQALQAVMNQTYHNLEIIVVNDNSTDNLREVIQPYLGKYPRIRYEKLSGGDPERFNKAGVNVNAGWQARNYGADLARGNYVVFQDADDGSLANRIEVQFQLMQKYNSHHAVVDWQPFKEGLNGKILNFEEPQIIEPQEIIRLARKTGPRFGQWWLPTVFPEDNLLVKWLKRFDRQLLRRWDAYPLAANSVMVRKEVFDKVRFRPLRERTRPSQKGRGVDRDFNFVVAETFKDSIAIKVPLYLWRI